LGWPFKPDFGLSGAVRILNFVIPTAGDHREDDDLRSGGTLCLLREDGEDRRAIDATKTRPSSRKTLSCDGNPTQTKSGLNGSPAKFLLDSALSHYKRTRNGSLLLLTDMI
jgi:hypothetical protein